MKTTLKKIDDSQVELIVELDKKDLEKYIQRTEEKMGDSFKVDGFRKGKLPKDLLRKYLGKEQIMEAALNSAIEGSTAEAVTEQKLDMIGASKLDIKENDSEHLVYSIIVSVVPEIELPDLSKFSVAKKEVIVEPKEIDETLNVIKASRAKLSEKDGPATEGDRVEIDFEVKHKGKIIEGGVSKNHPLVIGGKNFIPGFEEQLVGMSKNDKKEFSLKAPVDYFYKEIAGKDLDFTVTVNDVKKVELPELDDNFAKSLGRFGNIDQLIMNVKQGLTEEKSLKEKQRIRLEILDSIIKDSKIPTPEPMIEEQTNRMMKTFDQDLHKNGMELSLYLTRIGKTEADLKKEWRKDAERQVKIALILHKVSKDNKIAVSTEELNSNLNETLQAILAQDPNRKLEEIDLADLKSAITKNIINEKTLEFLEKTCCKT